MSHVERSPFGGFLDDLPTALYVGAHIVFFSVGLWLWVRAAPAVVPHPSALLLYVVSQAVFFGFFAKWITLKMAVLAEQTLMLIMVCVMAAGVV